MNVRNLEIVTATDRIIPPGGKKEFRDTIKSTARILSQSILQAAKRRVLSTASSASLSNSPQS